MRQVILTFLFKRRGNLFLKIGIAATPPAILSKIRRWMFSNQSSEYSYSLDLQLIENPKVSIILPNYNHGRFLLESIESLMRQNYKNIEIIVVDDGSTDNSKSVLTQIKNDPRIHIYRRKHEGLTSALNFGFSKSNGEFLTWTSADNILKENAIEFLVDGLILNREAGLIYSDYTLIDQKGELLKSSTFRKYDQNPHQRHIIYNCRDTELRSSLPDNFIGPFFMYRREVYEKVGDFQELHGFEDYDYWLRVNKYFKICHTHSDGTLYRYRIHDESLSANAKKNNTHRKLIKHLESLT